ncbi:hypothetical protein AJOOGB_AJOOGB_11930, partial [Dysosmobacter welbionis]
GDHPRGLSSLRLVLFVHPVVDLPAHPFVEGVLVPFPGLVLELPQDGPFPVVQARHVLERLCRHILRDAVPVTLQSVDLFRRGFPAAVGYPVFLSQKDFLAGLRGDHLPIAQGLLDGFRLIL